VLRTGVVRPSSRSEMLQLLSRLSSLAGGTRVYCTDIGTAEICIKLEYANPTGSHKDRIALYMLRGAVLEAGLGPGECVAEVSSGNTAAAVAWAASLLGLKPVLFVEKTASRIKKALIRSLGGELVEIGDEGLTREWAREEAERRGCLFLDQMSNEYNMLAHYETTGREILRQLWGRVDAFVMGVGTGGTITGAGRRLREELGNTMIVAVTPAGSPLDPSGRREPDPVEGLTSASVPPLYRRYAPGLVDRVVAVPGKVAARATLDLYRETGVLAGPSTAAAYVAAKRLLEEEALDPGSRIAIVAADSLTRYPDLLEA
jgi:cysteine synthase A